MWMALTMLVLVAGPDAPVQTDAPSATAMADKVTLMETNIREYLIAERNESILFVAMGTVALGLGAFLLTRDDAFAKGAAWPLMAVALIQLVVGGSVWWRTEAQTAHLVGLLSSDSLKFVAEETARMAAVNRNFDIYKIAEIVIAVLGVGMIAGGYALGHRTLMGIGAGMAVQGVVMLSLDFVAEARADKYTAQIVEFSGGRR